ncbi:hypothetical protein GCK32_012898 [Trichostrongylus colubriformis]|uniref:Uncharacterized protein n=1 Tax=Trichostrongylus colubriformis TaxID=6319 RepID=A0AAN8FLV4_TRICO
MTNEERVIVSWRDFPTTSANEMNKQKSTEPIRLKPILLPSPPRLPTNQTTPSSQLIKSSSPRYCPYMKPGTSSPVSLPSINTVLPPSSPYSTPVSPSTGGYCTFSPESGTVTPLSQPLFIQTDDSYWYGMSTQFPYDVCKFGSPPVMSIPYPYSHLPNGQTFSSSCY